MADRAGVTGLRLACARALDATLRGASLDETRNRHFRSIPADQQALARELLDGTVRFFHRLDWQLGGYLKKPLDARDGAVRALLLLGLYQLQFMRTPPARVVNESVETCRALKRPGLAGLVNAVLRRASREASAELPATAPETARQASPQWLLDALRRDWPDRAEEILRACNDRAPMAIRVNRLKSSRAGYQALLQEAGIDSETLAECPYGLQLAHPVPATALPGFAEGRASVQDASAQQAAELLGLRAGQRVLDACAAPGGKSAHLLERCPDIRLACLDVDGERLRTLRENLDRLGLAAAEVLAADAADTSAWWDGVAFDRILLDAPCSATGVIRRHPDIRLLRRENDVAKLAGKQRKLLQSLWKVLTPGGHLLYATCSLLRQENEAVVTEFLRSAGDARPLPLEIPGATPCAAGYQRFPAPGGGDGFFYCLLEKA